MIDGILPVDKPIGWTSHDVVGRVRQVAGQRAVGHAGTLDPLATGVLLLVLGRATRLSSYLTDTRKTYCAEVVLGATTATDDAEASLLQSRSVARVELNDIERCIAGFIGRQAQRPPAYSAVRQGGEHLYTRARRGEKVEPPLRAVTVYAVRLVRWQSPRLRLLIECSSGTYIRSLARDIGETLGVGGYLHALQRVSSGRFGLRDCVRLPDLETRGDISSAVLPADFAVHEMPAAVISAAETAAVLHGSPVQLAAEGTVRLYDEGGRLLALAQASGHEAKPFRVLAEAD